MYARSELEAILTAPQLPRDRAFLMAVYAGGLLLSEATHLKTTDCTGHACNGARAKAKAARNACCL